MTTKRAPGPKLPPLHHSWLTGEVRGLLAHAIAEHMPADTVSYDVSLLALPEDDGGWIPSMLLYVQSLPVGDLDGWHRGIFASPYGLSSEWVDSEVALMAAETVKQRRELREAREAGAPVRVGLAVEALGG